MNSPQAIQSVFDSFATAYQDAYMDQSLYQDSLDLFCQRLKKESPAVLELACGPGNITRYLLTQRPDLQIRATDLSPKMIELAKKNNPDAQCEQMDIRDLGLLKERFDALVCGFCLPYLSPEEASRLLSDAFHILEEEGILYLSAIEQKEEEEEWVGPSSGEGDPLRIQYYTSQGLKKLLISGGFKDIDLLRVVREERGEVWHDLLAIAKKGKG